MALIELSVFVGGKQVVYMTEVTNLLEAASPKPAVDQVLEKLMRTLMVRLRDEFPKELYAH